MDLNKIVDRLLNMKPDPIPEFVLLKEFKGCPPDSKEYKEAYKKVCIHPNVGRAASAAMRKQSYYALYDFAFYNVNPNLIPFIYTKYGNPTPVRTSITLCIIIGTTIFFGFSYKTLNKIPNKKTDVNFIKFCKNDILKKSK